jgi:hypothetical protein
LTCGRICGYIKPHIVVDVKRFVGVPMNTLKLWPDVGRDILHLSRNATYDAAARGDIPTVRFGKTIRVPEPALRRLLDSVGAKPAA